MSKPSAYDVCIIGGGAAGLLAAVTAARMGGRVLLVEQKDRIGKKIHATGNGKCNFTNENMSVSFFHGERALIESVLSQFDLQRTLDFFHEIGIYPMNRNGYYYPASEQADSVVAAFQNELCRLDVDLHLSEIIFDVREKNAQYLITTSLGTYISKTVIFAVGLLASPKLGSDGSAFAVIKNLGHHFCPMYPVLCAFYAGGIDFKQVAGVRVKAEVSIISEGVLLDKDRGELQLTDYGISGIPVFQVSKTASSLLNSKKTAECSIRFLPELSAEDILQELRYRMKGLRRECTTDMLLEGLVNRKLIPVLLANAGISVKKRLADITEDALANVCRSLTDLRVTLEAPRSFDYAQVCAGGIRTSEVETDSLMSKILPGIFFAGELLDVDGICGGYNLQWAWSSGYVAGMHAMKYLKDK